jgi:hypothetical protein
MLFRVLLLAVALTRALLAFQFATTLVFRDPAPQTPCATPLQLVNLSTYPANIWVCKSGYWTLTPQLPAAAGGSGIFDCVSTPGVCDIRTELIGRTDGANVWKGANDYSQAPWLAIPRQPPASSTAPCVRIGELTYDSLYLYVCIAANGANTPGLWARVPLASSGW